MVWTETIRYDQLRRDGKAVVKLGRKQIALFDVAGAVYACNNRCPHEGYPLSEGTLDACVLTCNWHGWRFDLKTGDNLYQGDRLRTYPTRVADGAVWIDVAEQPQQERQARALANLQESLADHEYDRIARELARLEKAGGDPHEALIAAIEWSHDRLPFGTTHAFAGAEAWLRLRERFAGDSADALVCLLEAIGHIAWDCRGEEREPFGDERAAFTEASFLAAIEAQDEAQAVAQMRGGLVAGLRFAEFERALSAAALAHYADFGHSLIYVMHTGRLIARLGERAEAPLLLALTRSLANASREDLIPEFRAYGDMLAAFPPMARTGAALAASEFLGRSVRDTMQAVVDHAVSVTTPDLYRALLAAGAMNLLRFDLRVQEQTDNAVGDNVGWLDFTHAITFANAARLQCSRFPELWPAALLQMACFVGRNAGFTDGAIRLEDWRVPDRARFEAACVARITDHAQPLYIHSVHLLKTFLAAREEIDAGLPDDHAEIVLAAVNRFFNAPIKTKHARRTAQQALGFVARED
jgi:nitrite reductase/ring-hydroxylating ferredoxin subunit